MSPIFRLIHRLVASTICQREETDKVPIGDFFFMWCRIHPEVRLNLFWYLYQLDVPVFPWGHGYHGAETDALNRAWS